MRLRRGRGRAHRRAVGGAVALRGGRGRLRYRAGAGQRLDLYARRLRRLAGPRAGGRRPAAARCATTASEREECRARRASISRRRSASASSLGPQSDYFSDTRSRRFFDSELHRRRGLRSHGHAARRPQLRHARGFNIVSDGIAPGSIQVPGNGQPIVLLADRQTDRRLSQDRDRHLRRPAGARAGLPVGAKSPSSR